MRLPAESKVQPVLLEHPYQYIANFPGSQKIKVTLVPGRYVAVARDKSGVYYVGPSLCYRAVYVDPGWMGRLDGAGKHMGVADCGIHVPDDETKFAYAFSVVGTHLSLNQMKPFDDAAAENQKDAIGNVPSGVMTAVPAGVSPLQAGLGLGIGLGIAGALAAAEEGRFVPLRNQEESPRLRKMAQEGLHAN